MYSPYKESLVHPYYGPTIQTVDHMPNTSLDPEPDSQPEGQEAAGIEASPLRLALMRRNGPLPSGSKVP